MGITPTKVYGITAVVAILAVAYGAQINHLKTEVATGATALANEQRDRKQDRAVMAEAAATAVAQASKAADLQRAAAQKVIDDERKTNQALAADRDRLRIAAGRVLDAARAAAAAARRDCPAANPPGPGSSTPATDPAGVLADVYGECVAAYSGMADEADKRGLAGATSWSERATLTTEH